MGASSKWSQKPNQQGLSGAREAESFSASLAPLNPSFKKPGAAEMGFLPLENNRRQKPRLQKIEIPSRHFPTLREDLGRCGINSGTLFGDLSGLTRQITWEFSPLEDELEREREHAEA